MAVNRAIPEPPMMVIFYLPKSHPWLRLTDAQRVYEFGPHVSFLEVRPIPVK